ncbi:hypothetical protein GA0116996_101668 [Cupriavidus alkaliphilus]|nr:hypothetical protein GA0116996_101668 [Cupriavidus alkaliphilus]
MLQRKNVTMPRLMLAPLALLLSSCACELPSLPQLPAPPAIPALPAEARQPETPSMCLPTCSAGLTRERGIWLSMPIAPGSPALPVSEATMR